jgi:diaminopimelate decarboxylase
LHAGYEPEKNILYSNGVSLEEIEEVNAIWSSKNIDNLSILEQFGTKYQMYQFASDQSSRVAGGNANICGHIDSKWNFSSSVTSFGSIVENTKNEHCGYHPARLRYLDIGGIFYMQLKYYLMQLEISKLRILRFRKQFKIP